MRRLGMLCVALALAAPARADQAGSSSGAPTPPALLQLAREFREWRRESTNKYADLGVRVAEQKKGLAEFKRRLEALRKDDWAVPIKVDFLVVRSEMDDLDFDLSVIRQVSRNPDFYIEEAVRPVARLIGGRYQSGKNMITVPYDAKRADAIINGLNDTQAVVEQAPRQLTEAVPEMADVAIERLENVRGNYNEFARVVGQYLPEAQKPQIARAAEAAATALEKYRTWLIAERPRMKAPYAIGRRAFEWYVQRVMMMPYTSDQLLTQAEVERDRGWAFLEFERLKNKNLPAPQPAATNAQYSEWKDATDVLSRMWAEEYNLFTRPNLGPMRDEDGGIWIEPFGLLAFPKQAHPERAKTEFLVPPDHWFSKIYWEKGHRLDPGVNHPHSDYPGHTFESAASNAAAREIRKGANGRGDAWCYYMEEAQLQLNYPFVRGPRIREWMYNLHIMRAERVYVAVKFADGSMKPADVEKHFMQNAPGMEPYVAKKHEVWRKYVDPAQVLTYQVGRAQIYELMGDRMKQLGDKFDMREFGDALLATGQIPISLARWELTGYDDEVKELWKPAPIPVSGTSISQPDYD